jgi:hypothetical protein
MSEKPRTPWFNARILFGAMLAGVALLTFGPGQFPQPRLDLPLPSGVTQPPRYVERALLDLPFDDRRLTPELLPARVRELLGKRIQLSGYLTPSTMGPWESMSTVFLRRNLVIPNSGSELARDYIVVDLRRAGDFAIHAEPSAFEGVFGLRDVSHRGYATYSLFTLTDAVEVPAP